MKIRSRLHLALAVTLATTLLNVAMFAYFARTTSALSELRIKSLDLGKEIFRFRYLSDELLVVTPFSDVFDSWKASRDAIGSAMKEYGGGRGASVFLSGEADRKQAESLVAIWAVAEEVVREVESAGAAYAESGSTAAVIAVSDSFETIAITSAVPRLRTTLDMYLERSLEKLVRSVDRQAAGMRASLVIGVLAISSVGAAAALLLLLRLRGRVGSSIGDLESVMRSWRGGDFTVEAARGGGDELGEIAGEMNGTIGDFSARAAKEIGEGVGSLDTSLSGQSEALARSNGRADEIRLAAARAEEIALRQREKAESLEALAVDEQERLSLSAFALSETSSQADEVMEVVAIINAVAERTDILAMNAAIEAAHAGEAGKGFSVVADEIRELAESTDENSKLIARTIGSITSKIRDVSASGAKSDEDFKELGRQMSESRASMEDLLGIVQGLSSAVGGLAGDIEIIAANSQDVKSRSAEILKNSVDTSVSVAIVADLGREIDGSMGEIETGSRDSAAAMQHLRDLSWRITESIKELKEKVSGYRLS